MNKDDRIDVRIVIYTKQDLKDRLVEMAKSHEPRVSASALGAMVLELGLDQYESQQAKKVQKVEWEE